MSARRPGQRAWPPERVAMLEAMVEEGLNWREIGEVFGIQRKAAAEAWSLYGGLPDKPKPVSKPRLCLCGCGKAFGSKHVGERISPKCRGEWEQRV